jgi:DNA-binding response OmpR family regulator
VCSSGRQTLATRGQLLVIFLVECVSLKYPFSRCHKEDFMKSDPNVPIRIGAHTVVCHASLRVIVVDDAPPIRLTPTEYALLVYLISEELVRDEQLRLSVFADLTTEGAIRKHIERLQAKLRPVGLSIHRFYEVGYVLDDRPGRPPK